MAKEKLIFKNTKSYDELIELLEEQLIHMDIQYLLDEEMEQALASLHTSDNKKRKRILTFVNHVDRKMNFAGQAHKNRFHKIPTILSGIIYLDLYPETVSNLTLSELEILSHYSTISSLTFYKTATMYYTKELLGIIDEKGKDYSFKSGYMLLTEKYFKLGNTPQEVAKYFESKSSDELTDESIDYEKQIYIELEEEMAKNESGGLRL